MDDAYMAEDINDAGWKRLSFGDDRNQYVVVAQAVGAIGPVQKGRVPDLTKPGGHRAVHRFKVFLAAGGLIDLHFNSGGDALAARNRLMVKVEGAKIGA